MELERLLKIRKVAFLEFVERLSKEVGLALENGEARYYKVASLCVSPSLIEIRDMQGVSQ